MYSGNLPPIDAGVAMDLAYGAIRKFEQRCSGDPFLIGFGPSQAVFLIGTQGQPFGILSGTGLDFDQQEYSRQSCRFATVPTIKNKNLVIFIPNCLDSVEANT